MLKCNTLLWWYFCISSSTVSDCFDFHRALFEKVLHFNTTTRQFAVCSGVLRSKLFDFNAVLTYSKNLNILVIIIIILLQITMAPDESLERNSLLVLLPFYCDFHSCILSDFTSVYHQALFQKIDYQQFLKFLLTNRIGFSIGKRTFFHPNFLSTFLLIPTQM